ncbi:hypothetical protein D3C72_1392280 [compost metagenome]
MPGLVFLAGAHVELVQGARILLRFERPQRRRVEVADAGAPRHVARLRTRGGQRVRARFRQGRMTAVGQFPARQQPLHGAVAQRSDPVGNARVDQGLRTHDAARTAGAVHHHEGLGIGRKLANAIDQLRARQAVRERQGEIVELLGRAAIDHHDVVAARHALVQLIHVDPRGVLLVLDDFTERLAVDVGAREQLEARAFPAVRPARQYGNVGPPQPRELGRGLVRQGLIVVDQHDARVAARHQAVGQQFQAPQRRRRGMQQVPAGIAAGFAHVEHGDFLVPAQRVLQRLG